MALRRLQAGPALAGPLLAAGLAAVLLAVPVRAAEDGPATAAAPGGAVARVVTPAASGAGRLIPAADLQADVALLRRIYGEMHPGLYRYRSREQIDAEFDRLARTFERDQTLAQAYLALARFTTAVQCGHTYPNFFNQGDAVRTALLEAPRLPFEFRWLDRRMIVTRSYADTTAIRPGTEILSIDGIPADTILASLMSYSRADGSNDAKRIDNLEVQGLARYEAFDVFYPLVYPHAAGKPYLLTLRTEPGGPVARLEVAAIAPGARVLEEAAVAKDSNPWTTRVLGPGIDYLAMPGWALYNSKWDWATWLDGYFSELVARGSRDLVIDLRGNEGGLSIGDRILAHLTDRDLPAEPVLRRTRYRSVAPELKPYLDTWDESFYDWGDAAVPLGDGYYRLTKYDNADAGGAVVKPIAPRYTGRVWVLIGAGNSSATFEFASAIKRNRLGTLVGQTTGGNQRGITGGAFFFVTLPKSGIEVDLPLIGQFPVADTLPPDAGLDPDVVVRATPADIAQGRDPELEVVLASIRKMGSDPK